MTGMNSKVTPSHDLIHDFNTSQVESPELRSMLGKAALKLLLSINSSSSVMGVY